ncbi:hypothetical protein [Streptomyces sp. Inha503]|uniref:hypothetical protein n=1 Tax=Streptomyces sp. Inha503 TaxID=3383314 RepID=UPI0039A0C326
MTLTDLAAGSGRPKTDLAVGVERRRERVLALSRSLHAHPEVAFGETASSAAITELLERGGFDVERGTGGLPTASTATAGSGEPTVALCVEYDALPEVGHACGHNLIPERAVVDFECRAFTLPEYEAPPARVRRCFKGAALATGADAPIHAHGFTALADTPEAYRVMCEAALAPAWTVADTATDPPQRKRFATTSYRRNPTQETAAT